MKGTTPAYFGPGFQINQEEKEIPDLTVTGNFPKWISGDLIRNGPGLVNADKPMRHWFDGLAMLHKFSIQNGRVGYQSKFLDCMAYQSVQQTGKITYADFATDPCRSLFGKIQTVFNPDPKITDSAKVNVGKVGEDMYALGEPLMQIRIDPVTLRSLGVFHFGQNPGNRMTTAHPHYDHQEAYNLVVQYGPINFYKIYGFNESVRELASIPVREPAYMHSFGMSENFFIISEFPLVVQSLKLALRLRPFIENFKWKPDQGTRFIIIDRTTGKVLFKVKTESFFGFHHVNACERNGRLVVDMVNYADSAIIDHYYKHRLESPEGSLPKGRLERFEFDVVAQRLERREILSETCIELPHIHYPSMHGNPDYRFVYGCGINESKPNEFYNQIVKVDIQTGLSTVWFSADCYPGEPVFIPHPDRNSEDHGVLLSVVLNAHTGKSFLLLLNSADLTEMARAELPHSILFGYHGLFNSVTKTYA
ncbi:MAG: hypothetical protein RL161_954 [Bacteroidota bacterium]|jgi:carotenoid cleavage dioxygenase-like enzyme